MSNDGSGGKMARRRWTPLWLPVLVGALCGCASGKATSVQRATIPARPTIQQQQQAAAAMSSASSPARPQGVITPGSAGGPVIVSGGTTAAAPLSAEARAVTSTPLPPLTAADRAAAARQAGTASAAANPPTAAPPTANPPAATPPRPPLSSPTPAAAVPPLSTGTAPGPVHADEAIGQPQVYTTKYEDTLLDLALDRGFGFLELRAANPTVDPWLPGAGTPVLLPYARILPDAPHNGLVLNLPEQRLYFFKRGSLVDTYPIGVFRDGFSTPIGSTTVVRKVVDPTWYPPASSRRDDPTLPAAVPPGPDNPLGNRAMYLGWPRYLIHGTNKPYGVGRRVSRGCIRMYPDGVERLFDQVAVGTPVHVVNQPIKIGWWQGELFVQAYPTLEQGVALEETGAIEPIEIPNIRGRLEAKAGPAAGRVDWPTVERALAERRGYPVQVTAVDRPIPALPTMPIHPPQTALAR